MEELAAGDELPRSQLTEAVMEHRAGVIQRLGRSISLQELMQHLQQVPPENVTLVQKYQSELERLLTTGNDTGDPFEDPLLVLELPEIQQAAYETESEDAN